MIRTGGLAADVAVIGAGPAGSVAAALLARAGCRVALVDRPDDGRPRIGETLPAAAARLLRRHGLPDPGAVGGHTAVRGTISAWGGPPAIQDALMSPEGPDWRLDRPAFDTCLRAAAHEAGAVPVPGRLVGFDGVPGAWGFRCEDGSAGTAGFLVDATGRAARVARRLGAARRGDAAQLAVWAVGAAGAATTDRTLIESTAEGWWYGARLPGGAPLAAVHAAPGRAAALRRDPARWRAALDATAVVGPALGGAAAFAEAVPVACDARGQVTEPAAGPGWAACGDAALAFDPVASQGLLNALATAVEVAAIGLSEDRAAPTNANAGAYRARLADIRRIYAARIVGVHARLGPLERVP